MLIDLELELMSLVDSECDEFDKFEDSDFGYPLFDDLRDCMFLME